MSIVFSLFLIPVLLVLWSLTLLNLPGNWLMVLAMVVYVFFMPTDSWAAIGWTTVWVLVVLAAVGEVLELLAGAAGSAKAGGSRRGVVFALIGSIVGGILGSLLGLPIPLLGPILAALLFAAVGALIGAMLGELSLGKKLLASWQIGKAAFHGRLFGTLAKMLVGVFMIAAVAGSILL